MLRHGVCGLESAMRQTLGFILHEANDRCPISLFSRAGPNEEHKGPRSSADSGAMAQNRAYQRHVPGRQLVGVHEIHPGIRPLISASCLRPQHRVHLTPE